MFTLADERTKYLMEQLFSIRPLKVNHYQLKTMSTLTSILVPLDHCSPGLVSLFTTIFQLGVILYLEYHLNPHSLDVKIKVCLGRDSCQPRLGLTQCSEMGR